MSPIVTIRGQKNGGPIRQRTLRILDFVAIWGEWSYEILKSNEKHPVVNGPHKVWRVR